VQRDVTVLHEGADAAGEFVATVSAEDHSRLCSPAHSNDPRRAAVRATRSVRPARPLDEFPGGELVQKNAVSNIEAVSNIGQEWLPFGEMIAFPRILSAKLPDQKIE